MKKLLLILLLPLTVFSQSSNLITITNDMCVDENGRAGKTITRLFDGNLLSKVGDGNNEDAFALEYTSMIILPNRYGNMKFEVWENFGNGGTFRLRLYDISHTLLGTYSIVKSQVGAWVTVNPAQGMHSHSNVSFVEVYLPTSADLNINSYELRLYGDVTGAGANIYPGTDIVARSDPGKYGHGINVIDDRANQYLQGSPTTYLTPKMAASLRIGFEGMRTNHYPASYTGDLDESPFDQGRFGTNHIQTRIGDFTEPRGMQVQIYHGGGSIKNLSGGEAATSNNEYHPEVNNFKYLESGVDGTSVSHWAGKAHLIAGFAGLYGPDAGFDMTGITVTNGSTTTGQGWMHEIEVGNELNRDWHGAVPYHSPKVYYNLLKACYDEVKARDGNVLVLAPAVTFMDITFWRAVYFHHYWTYGAAAPFPCDGFNMNLYLNSDLDGQAQSGGSTGLNPEAWGLLTRLQALSDLFDLIFPNKILYMSEAGFASHEGSPYDVPAIGSKTAKQVSADIILRTKAITRCVRFIQKIFYYAFFEDGTGPFDSMGATAMTFGGGGSYTGNTVYAVGYALSNELFVEQNYTWFVDDLIMNGGTTGAWIMKHNHVSNPLKKLFKIARGTMNGSSSSISVPVGANAISATLYSLDYADFEPNSSSATIVGTNVSVTSTEGMQWLEVTYSEGAPGSNVSDRIKGSFKRIKFKNN